MNINERIAALIAEAPNIWQIDACGVTRSERTIPVVSHRDAYIPVKYRPVECG